MKSTDFPSLYQSANNASISTQRHYLLGIKVYLSLLVICALLTQFAPKEALWGIISALTLFATLGISIYQAVKRYDKVWYNGRAVAESVKTRTWRFIMRAEPYQDVENVVIVKKAFISDINAILRDNRGLAGYLDDDCTSNCISNTMLQIRSKSLTERADYYRTNRIDEQRQWYAIKAKWNKRQSAIWFACMITANALAIVFVLFQIKNPKSASYPIEPLIVIAGSILTWMQVKKFQDLATSYNLTAHEITNLRQESEFADTEKEFSDFVLNSENAFSREHTQWIARKDN